MPIPDNSVELLFRSAKARGPGAIEKVGLKAAINALGETMDDLHLQIFQSATEISDSRMCFDRQLFANERDLLRRARLGKSGVKEVKPIGGVGVGLGESH